MQITVFQEPEGKVPEISRSERDLMYDDLRKTVPELRQYFAVFSDLERRNIYPTSTIPAILVKYLARYFPPVIDNSPLGDNQQTPGGVRSQFDLPTPCIIGNDTCTVAPNRLVTVSGFQVRSPRARWDTTMFLFAMNQSVHNLLLSGKYTPYNPFTRTYLAHAISRTFGVPIRDSEFVPIAQVPQDIDWLMREVAAMETFYETTRSQLYSTVLKLIMPEPIIRHPPCPPQFELDPIVGELARIYPGKFSRYSRIGLANEIIAAGLFPLYINIRLLGSRDPVCLEMARQIRERIETKAIIATQISYRDEKFLELSIRRAIAAEKFKKPVGTLTDAQLRIVNAEYKKYIEMKSNPYAELAAKLQTAIVQRAPNLPTVLSQVRAACASSDGYAVDSSGTIVICSHVLDLATLVSTRLPGARQTQTADEFQGNLRGFILRYGVPTTVGYFCRICGEHLAEPDTDSEDVQHDTDTMQPIVWREVAILVTEYVRFQMIPNMRAIITAITDAILPHIRTVESAMMRVKTYTPTDVADLVSLYTAIYTFAYLINMIALSDGKISFTVASGTIKPSKLAKTSGNLTIIQQLLQTAIDIIRRNKAAILVKVPGISPDVIKPGIMHAFKQISSLRRYSIQVNTTKHSIEQLLQTDGVYNYLYTEHLRCGNAYKFDDFKHILGRTIDQIEDEIKRVDMYATAVDAHVGVAGPVGGYGTYNTMAYQLLLHIVKSRLFAQDIEAGANPRIVFEGELASVVNKLHAADALIRATRQTLGVVAKMPIRVRSQDDYTESISIVQHFCPDGQRHNFSIYVLSNSPRPSLSNSPRPLSDGDRAPDAGTFEVVPKIASTILERRTAESAELFTKIQFSHIVDLKCSLCGFMMTDVGRADNREQVIKRIELLSFYQLYLDKCPRGDLHTVDSKDSACAKCGFTTSMYMTKDVKYFDEYVEVFRALIRQKHTLAIAQYTQSAHTRVAAVPITKHAEWVVTNKNVLELSKISGVGYNILINLGLNENKKFETIAQEKENRYVSMSDDDAIVRVQYLEHYVLFTIRCYNSVRNNWHMPPDIQKLYNANRAKITELNFPSLPNFVEPYTQYATNDPKVLSNFLLDFMCGALIQISDVSKSNTFPRELMLTILSAIIEMEKSVTAPDMSKVKLGEIGTEPDVSDNEEAASSVASNSTASSESFGLSDVDIDKENMGNIADSDD